ncbi:RHS repeat protein [Pseudomonas sp. B1(2018)]|uniref:RHS repeat domain-containing protein n=1 Tax=Pseudomonas sp. B1(2018) TaxID=2233856 RepID=UPI000D5C653C|nr:RHS repeat-associated core domain-containing protein [Pseudomonas sp. B1(2018)]PVZ54403.1 RHS repeat protein [Pseudomonas sp. B1(2018)]
MNTHPHTATPTLSVIDPRTLVVRNVGYCRHPDSAGIDPRITRQGFNAAGRLIESWDPRLWGTSKPNLTTVYGLRGQPLLTDSVDGGWQLSLPDQAGSPCSFWDARGSQRHTEFDEQQRPITVTEQAAGELPRVVERLTYGDSGPAFAEHNQCGQLIRHDDPAGSQIYPEYGMAAAVLREERRFLAELETPDWPLEPEARDELLEPQSFITRHTFNPTGELRQQTDAMGNLRTFGYDLAGKPDEVWLQMAGEGEPPKRLVSAIRYNALDQVESESAGNGVVTRVEYAADDGRLLRLQAALGSEKPLQDLNYVYDPVGNIVELHDLSQPVTHFNNQRIDPINRYRYDSLYQLVEARGWEVSTPSHGPALPTLLPTPLDPNQRRNYTQQFEYDQGGNLITRQHSGAPGFSMFTSARSNRSLAQHDDGSLPGEGDIALGFDACGNQRELQRGQAMTWDLRNQLSQVTLVKRETEPDDFECYRYDRPGHRLHKVGFAQSSGRTLRTEVRYLPGLEIHRQAEGEAHHVISIEAGRSNVRALHWPQGEHSDQLRYSLSDYLGSSTLELDHEAGVLTQEHYYPFGGTACWAGKSALVAQYKTIRYSGKERDATGLYYYGYRYYAPWLQRWMSSDPAGTVNGLSFFCFVANNPIYLNDIDGRFYEWEGDEIERHITANGGVIIARGLEQFESEQCKEVVSGVIGAGSRYSGALAALDMNLSGSSDILQTYFGPKYSTVVESIKYFWKQGENLAAHYQTPLGKSKFVSATINTLSSAIVYPDDINGRIIFNVNNMYNIPMENILSHEFLHVGTTDEAGLFVSGTVDYFYLNGPAAPVSEERSAAYDSLEQNLSDFIMHGGLTAQYMEGSSVQTQYFISAVAEASGLLDIQLDLDFAVGYFNGDEMLRARVAAANPDSIAYAARSMNGLYRSSSSNFFYSVLNE